MYLKISDTVLVTAGADKGKQGKILRLDAESERVWVQGVNLRYKHLKRTQKNPKGGRVQQEASLHVSNVALLDPKSNKATRVGYRVDDKGRKVRFAKKSGEAI